MKIIVEISIFQYINLRDLLLNQEAKIANKQVLFSGTRMIRYEYIVIAFLDDRYLFSPEPEKQELSNKTAYKFKLYQAAALFYFLQDIHPLPSNLIEIKDYLARKLQPYMPDRKKSDFQKYYEENWMDEYQLSYTELRDEFPSFYNSLLRGFEDSLKV